MSENREAKPCFFDMLKWGFSQEAQGLFEYALIIILVAIIVLVIVALIGPEVGNMFSNVISNI